MFWDNLVGLNIEANILFSKNVLDIIDISSSKTFYDSADVTE